MKPKTLIVKSILSIYLANIMDKVDKTKETIVHNVQTSITIQKKHN